MEAGAGVGKLQVAPTPSAMARLRCVSVDNGVCPISYLGSSRQPQGNNFLVTNCKHEMETNYQSRRARVHGKGGVRRTRDVGPSEVMGRWSDMRYEITGLGELDRGPCLTVVFKD